MKESEMSANFEEFQRAGKEQLETASSVAASLTKGLQTIAADTTDFSKEAIEANSAYVEELMSVKSLEGLVRIQSEFAKSSYDRLTAQASKIGELYANLAKDVLKPAEAAFAKFQATIGGGAPVPHAPIAQPAAPRQRQPRPTMPRAAASRG
jgi:hypothetical protein